MKKKWITFDLDGTLMQNPFGEWVFPEIVQRYKKAVGNTEGVYHRLVKEHRKRMQEGFVVEAYNWDDIVRKVFFEFGMSESIDVTELVIKHSIRPKVYLLERNVLQALGKLREQGFHLAVVTNGFEKYQKPVMDELGLTALFDVIITPEKVGYGKPQTSMVNQLQAANNEIIAHVGDRIDHDVVFANELGVLSILIDLEMPEMIRNLDPRIRAKQCTEWLKGKWEKETETKTKFLPESSLPDLLIYTVEEICRMPLR